ncbi:MAG: hypothetical protein IJZ39_03305 [Oscillospiraceae bacterium]|nr:hypothetical protein [Oscillospiraceae bacterium]
MNLCALRWFRNRAGSAPHPECSGRRQRLPPGHLCLRKQFPSSVYTEDQRVYLDFTGVNAFVKVIRNDTVVTTRDGTDTDIVIPNVHLWNGTENPYLYTCEAVLRVDGVETDMVSTRFGARTFRYVRLCS